MTISMQNNL